MTTSPRKEFAWKAISVLSGAVIVILTFVLLAQSRDLIREINTQTDINQRYLRCILLIERDQFQNVETRVEAIDRCAIESKTPSGQPVKPQPTSSHPIGSNETGTSMPSSVTPRSQVVGRSPEKEQPSAPTTQSPTPPDTEPAEQLPVIQVVDILTKPVRELLGL